MDRILFFSDSLIVLVALHCLRTLSAAAAAAVAVAAYVVAVAL